MYIYIHCIYIYYIIYSQYQPNQTKTNPKMPRVLITSTLLILSLFSLSSSAHQNGDQNDVVNSGHRSSRSLVLAKAWCLLAVFAGTFLGGVSPYFLRWDERWLASGTHFAGGVFLATALIHFLADAHRTFAALTPNEYPFAFTLACAGYLLTLLADCIVSHVFHNKTRRDHSRRAVEEAQGKRSFGFVVNVYGLFGCWENRWVVVENCFLC